jgi:hypothetical protein
MNGSALRFAVLLALAPFTVSCGDAAAPGAGPSPLPSVIAPPLPGQAPLPAPPVSDIIDCELSTTTVITSGVAEGSTACERVGIGNVVITPADEITELFHGMSESPSTR